MMYIFVLLLIPMVFIVALVHDIMCAGFSARISLSLSALGTMLNIYTNSRDSLISLFYID